MDGASVAGCIKVRSSRSRIASLAANAGTMSEYSFKRIDIAALGSCFPQTILQELRHLPETWFASAALPVSTLLCICHSYFSKREYDP